MATDHLRAVRVAIRQCDGVVVFGFRQLQIDAGVWRPATPAAPPQTDTQLAASPHAVVLEHTDGRRRYSGSGVN